MVLEFVMAVNHSLYLPFSDFDRLYTMNGRESVVYIFYRLCVSI